MSVGAFRARGSALSCCDGQGVEYSICIVGLLYCSWPMPAKFCNRLPSAVTANHKITYFVSSSRVLTYVNVVVLFSEHSSN